MVENKKTKRERDIKSKLMAAIAMLLVSSIMMVSSTYAWFTLSTAPEVTGITTAVGANGNLEMALLPYKIDTNTYTTVPTALAAITSGTGDSMAVQAKTKANITWGNLVDLSDASYGLDKITLYPSQLSATGDTLDTNFLQTPEYGSDGRVARLEKTAIARLYENAVFGTESAYGVRAVGVSSGMSGREQAYRQALSAANSAATRASNAASTSLANGGTSLASIGLKKAQNSSATYTVAEVTALRTTFSNLTSETGALTYIEEALIQYLLADALVSATDETYPEIVTAFDTVINGENGISDTDLTGYITAAGLSEEVAALTELETKVTGAITGLDALLKDAATSDTFEWGEISSYVGLLGDVDAMTLCGQPMSYWMEDDPSTTDRDFLHMNELMGQVNNLNVVLNQPVDEDGNPTGEGGIYLDLADIVGYFESTVTFNNLSFSNWNFSGLTALMKVNPGISPTHLASAKQVAMTDATFTGGGSSISDYYGYILDLAFRTNAADSNLQLQTDAIDRIYSDNEDNANTMGHGSSMTFSLSSAANLDASALINLMSNIRIVFFNPEDNTIFGYARLDATGATNQEGVALTTKDADSGAYVDASGNELTVTSVTMPMKMWDPAAQNGEGTWKSDDTIVALTQNVAKAVSALVYLDGETITNASASTSNITGTMNLQFSSSAELTPMEYGELRKASEATTTYKVTVNGVDSGTTVNKDAAYSYTIPDTYAGYTITVSMGGTDVTADVYDADAGTVTIDAVTGDIAITATAPAGG